MNKYRKNTVSLALCGLLLSACDSPQETAESHLQKGKELFEKGEFDKAILELKSSSQDDKRGETYYYMALLDEKHNNFKAMREDLLKAVELEPGFAAARVKLAKVQILFGELDKAMMQADTVLAANPENIDAQLVKATVDLKQDKSYEADQIIAAVLKNNPDNIDALSLKANQEYQLKHVEAALALLGQALEKDNKNISLRLFRIRINGEKQNLDAIISDYQELIKLYPDAENFKLSLASIYSRNAKLPEAEALLRNIVDKTPASSEPKVLLLEFLNTKAKDRVVGEYEQFLAGSKPLSKQWVDLSKWMYANGYPEQAEKGLKQVVATEHNSVVGLNAQAMLAEIALNNKQYDAVASQLDAILQVNSDFLEASLLKARLLLAQNKPDAAIELLNKVVWTKTDADKVYVLLGDAYKAKNEPKQAEKNFKQALDVNPGNIAAFEPVYQNLLQENQKETARQLLDKVLKIKPNQESVLLAKTELDVSEKKWSDAQETLNRLALTSKNKPAIAYLEANIFQGKGQFSEAIEVYKHILEEFPDHLNSLVNLTRCYDGLKSRDKGMAYLEAHHLKYPEDLNVVNLLSNLYLVNQDLAKAKKLLTAQIDLKPKEVVLYLELARIEALMRKSPEGARDIYLKGLASIPDNPALTLALAAWYELNGDLNNAKKIYENFLEKQPNNKLANNNLASILIESANSDDIQKGMALAEKVKDDENPQFQDTYAWALVKSGRSAEALKLLESLNLKDPKLPELKYHLAVGHANNGNTVTAVIELKQAIALAEKQHRDFLGINDAKKLVQEIEHSTKK
jgi:tetratricopeptide (TPR) repeat protein